MLNLFKETIKCVGLWKTTCLYWIISIGGHSVDQQISVSTWIRGLEISNWRIIIWKVISRSPNLFPSWLKLKEVSSENSRSCLVCFNWLKIKAEFREDHNSNQMTAAIYYSLAYLQNPRFSETALSRLKFSWEETRQLNYFEGTRTSIDCSESFSQVTNDLEICYEREMNCAWFRDSWIS